MNRNDHSVGPTQKKIKFDSSKHNYPLIPPSSDDDISDKRNLQLLKEEATKAKSNKPVVKDLLIRTYPVRRRMLLESNVSVSEIVTENPFLKKCAYVSCIILNARIVILYYTVIT